MKQMNVRAEAALLEVARRHHTTVEEVRSFTTVPTSKSFISDTAVSPSL